MVPQILLAPLTVPSLRVEDADADADGWTSSSRASCIAVGRSGSTGRDVEVWIGRESVSWLDPMRREIDGSDGGDGDFGTMPGRATRLDVGARAGVC